MTTPLESLVACGTKLWLDSIDPDLVVRNRALGATGGQIRTLFLAESTLLGIAGSLAGIGAGVVLARGFAGSLGTILEDIYGVAQRAEEVSADPSLLGAALAAGIVTSLIAAWIPARCKG